MTGLQYVRTEPEGGSTISEPVISRRSSWTDRLVAGRESVLDLITGTRPGTVLNEVGPEIPDLLAADSDITADLKRFMDMVKIEAIDAQGYTVDYKQLKGSPTYLEYRQSCSPRLKNFNPALLVTREEKLAFWINLYNALIIDGVIAGEISKSIGPNSLALIGFFRKTAYDIAGLRFNADDIEHGILRGNRGHPMIPGLQFSSQDRRLSWVIDPLDVRIHFVLNCASRSCPPIQVYSADKIGEQLDMAARYFVDADLQIDQERSTAHISAIYKWFGGDFGGQHGVIEFLIKYLEAGERKEWLEKYRNSVTFHYKTYDWGLNSANLDFID
jgi:hypothetical protein